MAKKNIIEMLKNDTKEAAIQSTADTAAKVVQKGLVSLVEKTMPDSTAIKDALDSDVGQAFIKLIAGFAIVQVPSASEKPIINEIAAKLRQGGLSQGMNLVADEALDSFKELIEIVKTLPTEVEEVAQLEKAKPSLQAVKEESDFEEYQESLSQKKASL